MLTEKLMSKRDQDYVKFSKDTTTKGLTQELTFKIGFNYGSIAAIEESIVDFESIRKHLIWAMVCLSFSSFALGVLVGFGWGA